MNFKNISGALNQNMLASIEKKGYGELYPSFFPGHFLKLRYSKLLVESPWQSCSLKRLNEDRKAFKIFFLVVLIF